MGGTGLKRFYIYKITLLKGSLAGKYYYGKHKRRTNIDPIEDKYYGSGTIVKNYYKVYPFENGVTAIKEIIEYNDTEEENREREDFYIGDKYKTDPMCLNLKGGGIGGKWSEESKEKLRKANIGKKLSDEHKAKISKSLAGHKVSEETIEKFRTKLKGRKGHPMSDELREKILKANTGAKRSEEARARMSASHSGKVWTEAQRESYYNSNKFGKRVIQIKTNGETNCFRSRRVASINTNVSQTAIFNSIKYGKTDKYGNKWKYVS